jgi:hypothetical protein
MKELTAPELSLLFAYWDAKKAGRAAPARADIAPEELRTILPNLFILDVVGEPPRFRYRLAGTAFVLEYGREVTGKFVDELDLAGHKEMILAEYLEVIRKWMPTLNCWSFTKRDGRRVRFERLLLPLSKDGVRVDMILGGVVSCRGVSDPAEDDAKFGKRALRHHNGLPA